MPWRTWIVPSWSTTRPNVSRRRVVSRSASSTPPSLPSLLSPSSLRPASLSSMSPSPASGVALPSSSSPSGTALMGGGWRRLVGDAAMASADASSPDSCAMRRCAAQYPNSSLSHFSMAGTRAALDGWMRVKTKLWICVGARDTVRHDACTPSPHPIVSWHTLVACSVKSTSCCTCSFRNRYSSSRTVPGMRRLRDHSTIWLPFAAAASLYLSLVCHSSAT